MSVCLSHGGRNTYASQAPDEELHVATLDGVAILRRSAGGWTSAGRALQGKHISALMIEPKSGMEFAGVHKGGLFASADGGKTWEQRDSGIEHSDVYSLNFVEAGSELRLYAGTEPAHLYVSTDLGKSWRDLPTLRTVGSVDAWTFPAPPHVGHVKHITFDPTSPDKIYASIEVGGLLKSEDAGRTWRDLSGFYEDVHRCVIRPSQPSQMYVTGGEGVYYSGDEGETWEHITDRTARIAYPDALLIHPDQQQLVFMAGSICSPNGWRTTHDADSRIARSADGGRSWEYLTNGLPDHIRGNIEALAMNTWQGGTSLFGGTTDGDVFASDDGGQTWKTIANGLPPVSKSGHYRNLQVA